MTGRPASPSATSSALAEIRGQLEPRLWTRPLRELTPDTSYGFDVIRWADEVLHYRLDEWQRWLIIHACELLPDGRPRFRRVLVIVGRQNGKTQVLVILLAFWLFNDAIELCLGMSTTLPYAYKVMRKVRQLVDAARELDELHARRWERQSNGERALETLEGARYEIAAANGNAGRSATVHRLAIDELRHHQTYEAWDAADGATTAVVDAQTWMLTNAGSARSIVLNDTRDLALEGGDPELGHFEWSAPENAETTDPLALAAANPDANRSGRIRLEALLVEAAAAQRAGGEKLAGFRTEKMCITVKTLNPAVNPIRWDACRWAGDLSAVRTRVALCLDVAPDAQHATLAAAAVLPDGRVAVEIVAAWAGLDATARLRRELSGVVRRVRPRVVGWLPAGPAAELAADMRARPGSGWPPAGVELAEIRADTPAACMAFSSLVAAELIAQPGDPLLDAHTRGAEPYYIGDVWVFMRRGRGHVDATYAAAGAVQLARSLPPPIGKPRLVVVDD